MIKPIVFISCPYSRRPEVNVRLACECWQRLFERGNCVPFTAVWGHLHLNLLKKGVDYQAWMDWSQVLLSKANVVVRIGAESWGADFEVNYAKSLGIPVVYGEVELHRWLLTLLHAEEEANRQLRGLGF